MKKRGDIYLQTQRMVAECNCRAQYVNKDEEQRQIKRAWHIINIFNRTNK